MSDAQLHANRVDALLRRISELAAEGKGMDANELRFQASQLCPDTRSVWRLIFERRAYVLSDGTWQWQIDRMTKDVPAVNIEQAMLSPAPDFPQRLGPHSCRNTALVGVILSSAADLWRSVSIIA